MKRWLSTLLIIIFACIFLVSAFFLGRYWLNSRKQASQYDDLAQLMEQAKPTTKPTDYDTPGRPQFAIDPDSVAATTEPQPDENQLVTVYDPITGQPVERLPELAELFVRNPDLEGWIAIEDTNINYPVMHTPDEPDYYLYRNFYREDSVHGCIYIRGDAPSIADNVLIYGHRMKDGSMFHDLLYYEDLEFYEAHKYISFSTLQERHTYEIMAVFKTVATEAGYPYYLFSYAVEPEEFDNFVADVKSMSLYDTGVTAEYGDKLITLSTCEYSQDNGRMVVVAKRIDY